MSRDWKLDSDLPTYRGLSSVVCTVSIAVDFCPESCTVLVMTSTGPFTEVRDNLSEIMDSVTHTGDAFVITRYGRPEAVLLSIEEYEAMVESLNILSDEETMEALAEADLDAREGRVDRDEE